MTKTKKQQTNTDCRLACNEWTPFGKDKVCPSACPKDKTKGQKQ